MTATTRGLCVILTLWMVSSRPSASILPGASLSGAWWGTPQSKKFAITADRARRAGDMAGAKVSYRQGYEDALRRHDQHAIIGYLSGIAACELTQLRYRAARETLLEAKTRARAMGDREALGAIAVNLSNVYMQVRDADAAMQEVEDGRRAVATLRKPFFLPNLLIQSGRLHDIQRDGLAESFYRQGIQKAKESGNQALEALGQDLLGEERLGQGKLEEAEAAIEAGMRLREVASPSELDLSWWRMGDLERRKGHWAEAARYTDQALRARRAAPEYRLKNQRGEIRLAMGDRAGGLADLREAVELSSRWRMEVQPAISSLTAANEMLDAFVFSSFIEAAAQEALRTGDPKWAEEAFEALELNRAASLRESRALVGAVTRKLPGEYWEMRDRLRKLEAGGVGGGHEGEEAHLRLGLAQLEAKSGLINAGKNSENINDRNSLIHFRDGLGRWEVLLSFYLGADQSYLWAVTRDTVRLYRLAGQQKIGDWASQFGDAVQAGRPEAVELGARLYEELFGQLQQEAVNKPSWLLSLEGKLFEVPFAALVTEQKGGKVSYLVSKHSLQTIPGALLLSTRPELGTGEFLGVGDPIYNAADPRWTGPTRGLNIFHLFQSKAAAPVPEQYSRLVGSAAELKTSSQNWGSGSAVLLEGARAQKSIFLSELSKQPSVIHLATHVTYPAGKQQGYVAFGLGAGGRSEYLTTTDIASLRVPGALVVMTGCETGIGDPRPGVGLIGLTRAWQMAGASVVVATSWRVRDSRGEILSCFYKHLRDFPAAEALRLSQLEMLDSGTWRASPAVWASYQVTGGAR